MEGGNGIMSNRIIDEQVVKMEFDNAKFEQNAEASLRTIDKLKDALKFENADKGFSELEKAANQINMSKLETNIQSIADRFSTMGIIGASVLNKLTNSVMGLAGKITGVLAAPLNQIISGGKSRAMNIANAQFSLKGQGIDWKKESEEYRITLQHMTAEEKAALESSGKFVDSLYKDIDYAVSGTAYGLDSAAKAAAQLSASGVQIGDDMRMALRGISGVAAMTNSSYDEIADIYTNIAGKNKVQLSELNRISARGLGVAAKLAEHFGVTEAELSKMVSKGKVDFATFAQCMDDAFGEHAKEANTTFTGSLANVKAALSKIGADNFSTFYDQMVTPLNDIRKIINNINVALTPVKETIDAIIKGASSGMHQLLKMTGLVTDQKLTLDQMPRLAATIKNVQQAFLNLMVAVARVIKPFRLAFMDVFQPTADIFVTLSEKIRYFTEGLIINEKTQNSLYKIGIVIFKLIKTGMKVIGKFVEIIFNLADALSPVLLGVIDFIGFLADLVSIVIDVADAMGIFDAAIQLISTVILTVINVIITLISTIAQGILMFVNWIVQTGILDTTIKAITKTIDFLTEIILAAIDGVVTFFKSFIENNEVIQTCSKVIGDFIKLIVSQFNPAFKDQEEAFEGAITSGNAYLDAFNMIVEGIKKGFGTIKAAIDEFYKGSEPIGAVMVRALKGFNAKTIIDTFTEIMDYVNNIDFSIEGVGSALEDLYNNTCKAFGLDGSIPWENIKKIFMGGLFFQLAGAVAETTKVVSGLGHKVDKLLNWSVNWLKADVFRKRVSAFETIAKSIVMLAAALFIIAAIREDRLWPAVAAISVITFVAVALMQAIKYMDKRMLPAVLGGAGAIDKIVANVKYIADALATSVTVAGLGAAIFLFTAAIWLLAGAFITWYNIFTNPALDEGAVVKTLALIAVLLGGFTTMGVLLGKAVRWSGTGFLGLTIFIGALVAAVYAIIGAVILFNSINWGEYMQGIVGVLAALGVLVGVIAAINILTKLSSKIPGVGFGGAGAAIIGIALYLIAVVYAIEKLTKMDPLAVLGSFVAILGLMVIIVAAIFAITNYTHPGKLTSMIGLAFVVMAVAYAIDNIVTTMDRIGSMQPKKAILGFIEIVALLIVFGGSITGVGFSKASAGPFLGMAVMLIVVASALAWIALLSWPDILKGVITLGACMVAAGFAMKLASQLAMDKFVALGFAAIIIAIAGALWFIAKIDFVSLLKAMWSLVVTLLVCGQAMNMVSGFTANGAAVIAFAGVIAALGLALGLIAHYDDMDRVKVTAVAMSMVIIAVGVAISLVEKYGTNPMSLKSVAGMCAIIAMVGLAIGLIAGLTNADQALKAAGAITLVMIAVTALFVAITSLSNNTPSWDKYATPLAAVLVVLVIIVALLDHLVNNMNVPDFEKAQEKVLLVAEFVGLFAILTVIFTAVIAVCGSLGNVLNSALAGFGEVAAIVAAVIAVAVLLTGAIGSFADLMQAAFDYDIIAAFERGTDFWAAMYAQVGKLLGAVIGGFIGTLKKYMGGNESNEVSEGVDYVQILGDTLKKLAVGLMDAVNYFLDNIELDRLSDFTEAISNALDELKPGLQVLASFGSSGIDMMAVGAAIGEIVGIMSAVATIKENKFFGALTGGSELTQTQNALKNMAGALGGFADELNAHEFNTSKIDSAIAIAKGLGEINKAVIETNVIRVLSEKLGSVQNINDFGEQIKAFATALITFSGIISSDTYEFNQTRINTFMKWGERLQELQSKLPHLTAWDEIWGSAQDIKTFGDQLVTYATALIQFAAILQTGYLENTAPIDQAIEFTKKLIDLQNQLPESGGVTGIFFGSEGDAFKNFGANLVSFAGALTEFGTKSAGIDYVNIQRALRQATEIVTFFKTLGDGSVTSGVANFVQALNDLGNVSFDKFLESWNGAETKEKLTSAIENMLSYINTMDNSKNLDKMYQVGQNFAEKLVEGMKSEKAEAKILDGLSKVVKTISKNMKDDAKVVEKYHLIGKAILDSVSDGFKLEGAADKLEAGYKWVINNTGKNAVDAIAFDLQTIGEKIASYIAAGIQDGTSISTIAAAMQYAVEQAAAGLSATISVDVQANADVTSIDSKVLGDRMGPDLDSLEAEDEFGNKYTNGVKMRYKRAEDVHTKGIASLCTVVKDKIPAQYNAAASAGQAKMAMGDLRAEQKAIAETGKIEDKFEQDLNTLKNRANSAIDDKTTGAVNEILKGGVDKGFELGKSLGDKVPKSVKDGMHIGLSDKSAEEAVNELSDAFGLKKFADDVKEQGEEAADTATAVTDKVAGAMADGASKIGGGGGGGGGGGAAGGFVASYSEFWQNLYLVNQQGAQAFEQQFETFEQWQENTLKKTQEIIDNYKNAVVDAKKKAAEGLFSEVPEPKEDVTKEKLKKNLQDQVNQIKEFNNIILQLRTRLMGTNLFDAITEMGVDSIDELRALNSMTNEELSEYASLYDQKYVASFQTIQQKAQSELQNLYGGMHINIDQFATTFDGSLQSVEGYFQKQAEAIQAAAAPVGQYFTQGLAAGMNNEEAKTSISDAARNALVGESESAVQYAMEAIDAGSPARDQRIRDIGKFLVMGIAEGMKDPEAQQSLVEALTQVMTAFMESMNGVNNEGGLGTQLQTLGTSITQSITDALTTIDTQKTNFFNSGSSLMTSFIEGFESQRSIVQARVNMLLTNMATNIYGAVNTAKFQKSGLELFKAMMKGFEQGWFGAGGEGQGEGEGGIGKKTIDKIMKKMIKILKEYKGSEKGGKSNTFFKVGQELIMGLIKGLENKQGALYTAIENIIKTAIARAMAAADAHSPSRETMKIGEWMGEGFIIGLNAMSEAVATASSDLSEEALQGFRDISQVLGGLEDFDATPVIAPVMDLSNIQNGVSEMGSLLDQNSSYEMAASIQGGLDAQRTAKLNEMTNLRRAMDSVYSSNTARTTEMANLQAAVANLNSSINNQTSPDYTQLQMAINGLNSSFNAANTGTTVNMNPVFNIQSNDPEAVAEEVNAALQHMIDRRSAVWA
jgi:tape measure domain-containing protein